MIVFALVCTLLAVIAFYLASPNQRLLAQPRPAARSVALVLAIVAMAGWVLAEGVLAGVLGCLTGAMSMAVILPYLAWAGAAPAESRDAR